MYLQILDSINTYVTFTLLGLIWTIQRVHYPAFLFIAENKFSEFEKFHTRNISFVVAPLMVIEFCVSILLLVLSSSSLKYQICFLLVVLIWVSTLTLSIPCHKKLVFGMDKAVINKLVFTNWYRTIFWSLKAIFICAL